LNEVVNNGYLVSFSLGEIIALPFVIFIILIASYIYSLRKSISKPYYRYFMRGMVAKMIGGTVFCLIYVYYYNGGDTIGYFESARSFANLFQLRPFEFLPTYLSSNTWENYYKFDNYTGFPHGYLFFEPRTYFVIKIITPFVLAGFNSYVISTLILAAVSFSGIWRMYVMFCKYYPSLYKPIALGFIFLPSAIFWGSGILKDTITLSAFCWFVTSFEKIFIAKEKRLMNIILAFLTGYLVIFIKPYIMMAAIPGLIVWFFHSKVINIRNKFVKYGTIPFIFALSFALGMSVMSFLGDKLDKFSLNKVLDTAVTSQQDLKREEYQGHSFDIGTFDASVSGIVGKFPQATIAGLFRPFLWECKSAVMVLSGLENLALMYLFLYGIFKVGLKKIFMILFREPLLLFLFSYSIFFAFCIGISTSNFGALIRFKIAFAPFFTVILAYLYYYNKDKQLSKKKASA
jgi:hypothetical protein